MQTIIKWIKSNWSFLWKFGIVAIVILTVLFKCHDNSIKQYQQQITAWKNRGDTLLAQKTVIEQSLDSMTKVNALLKAQRDSLGTQTNKTVTAVKKLKARNDSLLIVLGKQLPTQCEPALQLAQSYKANVDSLISVHTKDSIQNVKADSMIAGLESGIHQLRINNDSLASLITHVPVYHESKILGVIPLPSRKVSFIAGIAIGVAAVIAIEHH